MSVSLNVKAFANKNSKEYQKHFKAVKFCIENELSFPKETSEFFKGKVDGEDLENIKSEYIINYIKYGVEIPLKTTGNANEIRINTSNIPKEVNEIVISLTNCPV